MEQATEEAEGYSAILWAHHTEAVAVLRLSRHRHIVNVGDPWREQRYWAD
jgi:hypothetical protein